MRQPNFSTATAPKDSKSKNARSSVSAPRLSEWRLDLDHPMIVQPKHDLSLIAMDLWVGCKTWCREKGTSQFVKSSSLSLVPVGVSCIWWRGQQRAGFATSREREAADDRFGRCSSSEWPVALHSCPAHVQHVMYLLIVEIGWQSSG